MKITRTTASVSSVIFTVCFYLITVIMPPWFYTIATGPWLRQGGTGQLSVFKLLGGRLWGFSPPRHVASPSSVIWWGIWDSGKRKYYEIWECNRSASSALEACRFTSSLWWLLSQQIYCRQVTKLFFAIFNRVVWILTPCCIKFLHLYFHL